MSMEFISSLAQPADTRLCLVVIDGLGGLPDEKTGLTELETASTPNLDALTEKGECGLMDPVFPGVTPGSGPGHLSLFGYDPAAYQIGRGVLSALGVDFPLEKNDIAARANFATVGRDGKVVDRRAGRIPTEQSAPLCNMLEKRVQVQEVKIFVRPEMEHRAVVVFRGEGLGDHVCDTDPQKTGVPPINPDAVDAGDLGSKRTAAVAREFLKQARDILKEQDKANMLLLRGFAERPLIPTLKELYQLEPAAFAEYPMYRGIARLLGMQVVECGKTPEEVFGTAGKSRKEFSYFFVHMKKTDSAGEDGNFEAKVRRIEEIDRAIPALLDAKFDVLTVTSDHSTPARYAAHSWHPVPVVMTSKYCRWDKLGKFSETACRAGSLSRFEARRLMGMMLANAKRLAKFGA